MAQFHTLYIQSVEKLTEQSVALTFDVPESLKASFKFTPSQDRA